MNESKSIIEQYYFSTNPNRTKLKDRWYSGYRPTNLPAPELLTTAYRSIALANSANLPLFPVFPPEHRIYEQKDYKLQGRIPTIKKYNQVASNIFTPYDFLSIIDADTLSIHNPAVAIQSDLIIIDIDVKNNKNGLASLEKLQKDLRVNLFDCASVITVTASGGFHFWFRINPAINQLYKLPKTLSNYPDIDILTNGNYAPLPPTCRHTGQFTFYTHNNQLKDQLASLTKIPQELLDYLITIAKEKKTHTFTKLPPSLLPTDLLPDQQPDIEDAIHLLQTIPPSIEGEHGDQTLFITICRLHELAISMNLQLDLLETYFNPRCQPPWSREELIAKINSVHRNCSSEFGCASYQARVAAFTTSLEQLEPELSYRVDRETLTAEMTAPTVTDTTSSSSLESTEKPTRPTELNQKDPTQPQSKPQPTKPIMVDTVDVDVPYILPRALQHHDKTTADPYWFSMLHMTRDGVAKSRSLKNTTLLIRNLPETADAFCLNTLTGEVEIQKPLPYWKNRPEYLYACDTLKNGRTVPMTEAEYINLTVWLGSLKRYPEGDTSNTPFLYNFEAPVSHVADAVLSSASVHSYNLLTQRLIKLFPLYHELTPEQKAEAKDWCFNWLRYTFNTEDTPYYRETSRIIIEGLVWLALHAGTYVPIMPIFEGEQHIGKSFICKILAFNDKNLITEASLDFTSDKEIMEATSGVWVVELPELQSLSKRNIKQLKAFITKTSEKARMAYAKSTSHILRHFMLMGSTNESAYLSDATGNRRFLPIECRTSAQSDNHADVENRLKRMQEMYPRIISYVLNELYLPVALANEAKGLSPEAGVEINLRNADAKHAADILRDSKSDSDAGILQKLMSYFMCKQQPEHAPEGVQLDDFGYPNLITTAAIFDQILHTYNMNKHSREVAVVMKQLGWEHTRKRIQIQGRTSPVKVTCYIRTEQFKVFCTESESESEPNKPTTTKQDRQNQVAMFAPVTNTQQTKPQQSQQP